MKKILIALVIFSLLLIPVSVTKVKTCQAGCCGCDPVYSYDAKGEVKSAVWVRDQACTATGAIIDTLKAGEVVRITDKTDGWYKVVSPRGQVGWSGEQFFTITDKALTGSVTPKPTVPTTTEPTVPTSSSTSNETTNSLRRLQGQLLLQVEKGGAIWYVAITEYKRYSVTFANALPLFEKLALGITDANLALIPVSGTTQTGDWTLRNRLKGRLLLAVEKGGMIWYVDFKGYRHNVTWANLMDLFETLSLGIVDANLNLIPIGTLEVNQSTVAPETPATTTSTIEQTFAGAKFISSGTSIAGDASWQKGSVPSGFNYKVVTQHILDRINYERTKRGKPAIVSDQRMTDTASVWAEQMYLQGAITHTRLPVNMIARQWVWQNFKIGFAEDWGWLYENIGGGNYSRNQGINESIMSSMDSLFDFYMSEEAANGIHFQTIMHDHLTHVGVGYYFDGINDFGDLFTVLHYGGLNGNVGVIDKVW